MLVLSRQVGEAIVIGDGPDRVTVVVKRLDRGKAVLSTDAPRHFQVDRQEVRAWRDARAREQRAAAGGGEGAPCPPLA